MTVLPTPFTATGQVDLGSLRALVDHVIRGGSTGLVCFGLASELYKLNDAERDKILRIVIEQAAGRVPVVAGSESNSIETAALRTGQSFAAGVDAVMVLPPTFVRPDATTVIDYYVEVAAAAQGGTVIVQDAPAWTGVPLPIEQLVRIREHAGNVSHVKVENPPNHAKLSALNAAGFTCIGGYGALHLVEDASAGITGVMYGAGTVAPMVALWNELQSDQDRAWLLFERLLPLLAFQFSSLDTFIAVQKELLMRDSVIASPYVRRPGLPLSDHQKAWLDALITRWERSSHADH